jgi:pimeloyl-ACP methyl ester carboxylesterase
MTTFVLIPGAGGQAWYWHRVVAELVRRGHHAAAVDLPGSDPAAGLSEYRDLIVAAATQVGGPVTLVAQSLGGFSAPLACHHIDVERMILVNAMIPQPGETAGAWWDAVGWQTEARASALRDGRPEPDIDDSETLFFHDLPSDVVDVMRSNPDAAMEAPTVFAQPWPLSKWPEVPTTVLAGRDDRLFPLALQQRVARQRLNLTVETLPGGHLLALGQHGALVDRIATDPAS